MRCIFSRPDWSDMATKCGTFWTRNLEGACPLEVLDLYQELARKAPNEAAIKETPICMYYGFGHGADYVFTGQENEYIIRKDNIALWDQAAVHLLSCSVFADLGLLFKHGSGYKETYYFYLQDIPNGVAEQYFDSDHEFFRSIWRGLNWGEAQVALKAKYVEWYQKGISGNGYLLWDADIHTISGDPVWKPTPPTGIKRLTAYYLFPETSVQSKIGDMTRTDGDVWAIPWVIPGEGKYLLIYEGEDVEGNITTKRTGEFEVKFPPSGIHIEPISPQGGETITARKTVISVHAWYEAPQ